MPKNYISSNRPGDIPNVSFNAPKNNRIILFLSSKTKVIITYGMTSRDVRFCCILYEKNIISGRREKKLNIYILYIYYIRNPSAAVRTIFGVWYKCNNFRHPADGRSVYNSNNNNYCYEEDDYKEACPISVCVPRIRPIISSEGRQFQLHSTDINIFRPDVSILIIILIKQYYIIL